MAYGGWLRAQGQIYPPSGDTLNNATARVEAVDQIMAVLDTLAGWSVKKAGTVNDSASAFGVMQHTDGAEFAFFVIGDRSAGAHINAVNLRAEAPSTAQDNKLWVGYIPKNSATAFDNAQNPQSTVWTSDTTLWFKMDIMNAFRAGGTLYAQAHFIARGGDVIFAYAYDSTSSPDIDAMVVFGEIMESPTFHGVNDTNLAAGLRYVGQPGTGISDIDFHNDGGKAIEGTKLNLSDYVSGTYTTTPPYNAVKHFLLNEVADGDVYSGDGLKGNVSDEVMFITPVGAALYSTWNSGTHVQIGPGCWVGWDAANGSW